VSPAAKKKRSTTKGSGADKRDGGEGLGDAELLGAAASGFHYLQPESVKHQGAAFARELMQILNGESTIEPGRDPRFRDSAWVNNPVYKRLGQSYLAFCNSLNGLLETPAEDWRDHERAKFLVDLATALLAPTNTLLGNPAALKKAVDTRGKSLLRGAGNFFNDLKQKRMLPAMADGSAYELGRNMAATPGAVVFRNDHLELIQYRPVTSEVYRIPVLLIAPQINKYYFLDLTPGRSLIEYLVSQGHQVFVVSWKNPSAEDSHWCLDDYCLALDEAVDAVRTITVSRKINTFGFCAGGLTMSAYVAHLIHTGAQAKINAISYAVTLMDFSHPAVISIFKMKHLLQFVRWNSHRQGLLKGEDLSVVFAFLRPNDLIWNYWVNNYLLGNEVPSFDIMVWNTDNTNLPEGLHNDYLNAFENNLFSKPGEMKILGAPVNLKKVRNDAFVAAAINDHLTPWIGCYQTTQLLGGKTEFVLSSAGHIAGLINPPGNAKSFYMTGPKPGADPQAWFDASEKHTGSWWQQWVVWASTRSGEKRKPRRNLGSAKFPILAEAPGTYVRG